MNGYNKTSLVAHWLTFIGVVALFVTHEAPSGSMGQAFHIGGGTIIGIFFLWRVVRRFVRGTAKKPDQERALNIIATIVTWSFLISLLVITITGILLPWSHGHNLEIYGLSIPSPFDMHMIHGVLEKAHNVVGHLFIPLILIHLLGVLKHAIIDKDSVPTRMFKPVDKGH